MLDRQAYAWQLPKTAAARDALAASVYADGTRHVRVKAGGDGGAVWIPGGRYPTSAGPQWDDAWLEPFLRRGIRVTPWFYNYPGRADIDAIVAALRHRWSDEIALNPEAEWRLAHAGNSFRTLAEANAAARAWVDELEDALARAFGQVPLIAFSGVPSWQDFPYEGFCATCDQAEPQQYWFPEALGGRDQVGWHLRRATRRLPLVPILTASREYDDGRVVQLGRNALAQARVAGFSSWECANASYQRAAMAQAYALLDQLEAAAPPARPTFLEAMARPGSFVERWAALGI